MNKLIDVANPTSSQDAATKSYVDGRIAYNTIFYSDINMTSHKFTSLAEPSLPSDSATKNYVDTHSSGGSISNITSDLDLNTHKLINVVNPTNLQDAATKNYVDTTLNAGLSLAQKSSVIGIDVNSGLTSVGLKSQILPVNTADATSIFTYSEGPGILEDYGLQ